MFNNWLYWSVPAEKARHYIIIMTIMMVIVPTYLFGIRFTSLGYLMNFLLYDALYYVTYRIEQAMKGKDDRD
jgi:hypothetical protein